MDRLSTNGQMLSQVELQKLPHSSFDMANHNFMSGKLGKLIPTRIDEVYPGDTIKGSIDIVSNFEPLVGPIMASMVTKQESFYVPLNEVWKNADKFFSAKKGFDGSMPTATPLQVFNAYAHFARSQGGQQMSLVPLPAGFVQELESLIRTIEASPIVIDNAIAALKVVTDYFFEVYENLRSQGEYYLVLDLLQPVMDRLKEDFFPSIGSAGYDNTESKFGASIIKAINAASAQPSQDYKPYLEIAMQVLTQDLSYIYDYFFGVSSLCDYVGWPVMDSWPLFFEDWRINSIVPFINGKNQTISALAPEICFSSIPLNWLKFRAIYLCWYWNYRDQLLEQDAYDPEEDDFLADTVSVVQMFLLTLLRVRCWYKDTYTTALTNTGTGNFRVPVDGDPISVNNGIAWKYYKNEINDEADVLLDSKDYKSAFDAGATIAKVTIGNIEYSVPMQYLSGVMSGGVSLGLNSLSSNSNSITLSLDLFDRLRRLQSFTEKELLLGYEIDDVIYAHFMTRLSNIRMRIPELLSRGREEVQINTIVNNTDVPNGQPAGDKTAVAWAKCRGSEISYFSQYWGYFISFYTCMPIQSYTGGLDRSWLKLQRFDYAWPDFATIGMDAVYNCELSAPRGTAAQYGLSDSEALAIFGYQGRYYDIKSKKDETHGRLRTDLNYLTFSREWNSMNPPKLNYIFVHCWPRLDMFVTDDPAVDVIKQIDVYHDIDYHRAFPVPSEYLG